MIGVDIRRVAEQLFGEMVGIARGGIGFPRTYRAARGDPERCLRHPRERVGHVRSPPEGPPLRRLRTSQRSERSERPNRTIRTIRTTRTVRTLLPADHVEHLV